MVAVFALQSGFMARLQLRYHAKSRCQGWVCQVGEGSGDLFSACPRSDGV